MTGDTRRLDKWLWFARFFKSRSLATRFCAAGRLRINNKPVSKPHYALKTGDVLTFPLGPHVRIIQVAALGQRRGPAPEARTLYEDLDPPPPRRAGAAKPTAPASRVRGAGRPTKAERRALDRLREPE
ncbi:MAG: RNA-binding S4 domain-containing protein [Rhodospirillales bacterium]|jgi:ribosome-associated heat shock protein Hsp15|nr:RNA-binding S4 domain-containing protein [Rhodospirillales bacterium]MDP6773992.1 RNA-binding S4 domain-containing protein [Rhodospirillales bacterium]